MYANHQLCNEVDYSLFDIDYRLLFLHLFYEDQELYYIEYSQDDLVLISQWEDEINYWINEEFKQSDIDISKQYIKDSINKLLEC